MQRDDAIRNYFLSGYSYKEIVHLLDKSHGFKVSIRHLKRIVLSLYLCPSYQLDSNQCCRSMNFYGFHGPSIWYNFSIFI